MVGLFQGICNVYNPQYELGFSKSKSGKYPKMVTSIRKIMINCGISGYLYHVLKESFSRCRHYIFAIDSSSEALLGGWKDAPFQICHQLRYFEAPPGDQYIRIHRPISRVIRIVGWPCEIRLVCWEMRFFFGQFIQNVSLIQQPHGFLAHHYRMEHAHPMNYIFVIIIDIAAPQNCREFIEFPLEIIVNITFSIFLFEGLQQPAASSVSPALSTRPPG